MKKFGLIVLLIVLAALLLATTSCDVISTLLLHENTPQSATNQPSRPSVSGTPSATRAPVKPTAQTPTTVILITRAVTAGPAVSTEDVGAWADICQVASTKPASGISTRFPLGSAVVMLQKEKATSWINQSGYVSIAAISNPDDLKYLVCIKESSQHAFNYTGGAVEGRRWIWNVALVNLASQEVFFTTYQVGANPPSFTTVAKGTKVVMGRDPSEELLTILLNQITVMPPLTAREEDDITSLAFSPDSKVLLVTTVKGDSLSLVERSLNAFAEEVFLTYGTSWKPNPTGASASYTSDGEGVVVRDFQKLSGHLHYLTIQRSAKPLLKLVGSAPCFGLNCEPGPVLPGNVIRRGDCEWRLDAQMTCTPRFDLIGSVIGSSANGEWLALGPQYAPTPTPTAVLSRTPTGTRAPIPTRTRTGVPGSFQESPTREATATRTITPTRTPKLTLMPTSIPEGVKLWNAKTGLQSWEIPVQSAPSTSSKPLNPPVVVFSPDGSLVAVKYYDRFEVWDTAQAKLIGALTGYSIIAFSPTQATLAAVNARKGVDLFDLKNLQFMETLEPKIGAVDLLAFSPDGKYLAVASGLMVRIMEMP